MNNRRGGVEEIADIESRLGSVLADRIGEIEKELEDRINREKEVARLKKEGIEKEFESERETLLEFKTQVRSSEEERKTILEEVRDRFDQVLQYQAEIENLAKASGEEIKKLGELQKSLNEIRDRTAEMAASIKKDLQDKFGITAEIVNEEEPAALDLDKELERLRQIKAILAGGCHPAPPAQTSPQPGDEGLRDGDLPEIRDLIAGGPDDEAPKGEAAPHGSEPEPGPGPEPGPCAAPALPVERAGDQAKDGTSGEGETSGLDQEAQLASLKKYESANGNGEIPYFQKDGTVVIDAEELLKSAGPVVAEARRLSSRLEEVESPKEQFFLKQELINCQEILRGNIFKVVRLCEKDGWRLPPFTIDILNRDALRDILEKLNIENWSNPPEFIDFDGRFTGLMHRFTGRLEDRSDYLGSILDALKPA